MPDPTERTRRLIARLTGRGNLAPVLARMQDLTIEVTSTRWTDSDEITAALTATLLLRLADAAPHIHLNVPAGRSRQLPRLPDTPLADALAHEHSGFSSLNRFSTKPAPDADLRLVIGDTPSAPPGLTVDAAGWRAAIGTPLTEARTVASPAAALAGVLAANRAFQYLLLTVNPAGRVRPWQGVISLWDYRSPGADGPATTQPFDLTGTTFIGCGGVASATGWTLALDEVTGRPHCFDPDHIDDDATNLNRHLTANFANLGDPKADLFAAMLQAAGAQAEPHLEPWIPDGLPPEALQLLVVTVDDDRVRQAVQTDLPRLIFNAGTNDDGIYQLTRHSFLEGACLHCIARAGQQPGGAAGSLARRLGLPLIELEAHLTSDTPLPPEVLAWASLTDDERHLLAPVPGRRFLQIACAHLRAAPDTPAISAPTLAAAPGVLLAAELHKHQLNSPTPLNVTANVLMTSILTGPNPRWVQHRAKSPGCICEDPLYRARYLQKWGGSP